MTSKNDNYEAYWRDRSQLKRKVQQAKRALELLKDDDQAAVAALGKEEPAAVTPLATEASRPLAERVKAQQALVAQLQQKLSKPPAIPPRAMVPRDDDPADEHIRLAGQFDRLGRQVPRGFLRVVRTEPVEIPEGQSGRLQFSQWLTDPDHGAGQLAARVLSNRIWHHSMGRGIVRTVDNFGRTGEPPSHPMLLDHLARELIQSDWSVKQLVRSIVTSRTFMLSSDHQSAGHERDPENRLLWRAHRRRIAPEALRDALLLAAGQLDFFANEVQRLVLGRSGDCCRGEQESTKNRFFPAAASTCL